MTPERWQQIETLYHAARERNATERAAFLAAACAEDSGLYAEVEALLRADEVTRGIIDGNVMEQAVSLHTTTAPLQLGQQLGAYKILALLGKGGMGEVYRARDTRLDRDVAIKVLPAALTNDPDRLSRFAVEAKATSALNHPNILTVHDVGQAPSELGGAPYLVAELLEGEELRAPLTQGALPVRKAIDYAQQIVAGLAAAHAKNIVHRDLKPENLFVTKDGRVKILDFGLAKLRGSRKSERGTMNEEEETLLQDGAAVHRSAFRDQPLTLPGTVMGTVAYMSPEQVRGETVDHRSDLFSFGLILFEMLRGERAFQKGTMAETMTAILNEEPPELGETNARISPQLEKIVRRCLEKKPEMRFQSTSDLGFALEGLASSGYARALAGNSGQATTSLPTDASPSQHAGARAYPGWRDRIWMIAAGVFALIALALGVAYFNRPANSSSAVRLSFTPPEKVAFDNGRYDSVVVSPDGQKLVFTGRSADGKRQLYVRPLDRGEATLLPGTEDALAPFWSPDSRSLGFGAQGKLKRLELAGGRPQTLCDAPRLEGGTWNREGIIVFAPNIVSRLFQVPATGGTPAPVTGLEPTQGLLDHRKPYFLPDGRRFLYRDGGGGDQHHVMVGSLDTKEVKQILADAAPAVYAPPGWLLFVRDGALVAQAFDATRLELKGEAVPLTNPIENFDLLAVPLSVAENGVLVWRGDTQQDYQLVWFDRTGKQESVLSPPVRVSTGEYPKLAPDGKNVAIERVDAKTRNTDIWTIDLLRNLPTRLTFDPAVDEFPLWSPDSSQVAFLSRRGGTRGFYQKAAGGGGEDSLLVSAAGILSDWSRDGRYLLYSRSSEQTRRDIWALPLFGERQPYALLNSPFDEHQPQLSPDMHWLAYVSDESGSYEIYVQPFTAEGKMGGDKKRISISGGTQPRFSGNGQELFYVAADGMMMGVPMSGGAFATPKALFKTRMLTGLVQSGIDYDVTADGQRFLIGTKVGEPTPVTVFLNWTAGLKK